MARTLALGGAVLLLLWLGGGGAATLLLGTPPYARDMRQPAVPARGFVYGVGVADPENAARVSELGFTWMKVHLSWRAIEPERGTYDWSELHKAVRAATQNRLGLLIRIDQAPAWAHPSDPDPSTAPDAEYLVDWERFLQLLAARGMGRVQAYEIWNEPNLAIEWGGKPPDPAGYQRLLRAAYRAIKKGDPDALVVSGGLASTGLHNHEAMDDAVFLRQLYEAGAAPYFDVLGYHPHGGGETPQTPRFRKAEQLRRIMAEYGDEPKAVWATELAWLLRPSAACASDPRWGSRLWESVGAVEQARSLVDAFRFVHREWPWMTGIFVFNLDFATASWYDACEPMTHESLLRADGAPALAFAALQGMPKFDAQRAPSVASTLPRGPVVKGSCDEIWVVVDGVRRWIPDVETQAAGGYWLEPIQHLQNEEIKLIPLGMPLTSLRSGKYPDNLLLLEKSTGQIDVVLNGLRRWIPDVSTFTYKGYCWENVLGVSDVIWQDIPVGPSLPRAPHIAFVSERSGNPEVEVINGDGTGRLRLTHDLASNLGPSWRLGNTRLAFVSTRDGSPQVYSMNSDGKALARLTDDGSDKHSPAYTSTGTQIAFISNRDGHQQLWVVDEDLGRARRLTEVEGEVRAHDWSRDGTLVAFEVEADGGRSAVWLAEGDGSRARRLADAGHSAWHPALSPKGDQVVYASDRDGSVDLYLMDIGKGDKRRLTANGLRNEMPSWSPSGTMIAWMAADAQGAAALHVMKADGSGQTKLLGGVQAGGRPPWAPESDALAAVLRQDGEWALHVIRPDGTRLRRLTGDHSPIGSPAWSR